MSTKPMDSRSSRRDCSARSHAPLTDAEVRVGGGVTRRAREVLAVAVRNVFARLRIPVAFCEAKVNDVEDVLALADAHEEVVGLDVAVDEVLRVEELDAAA